MLLSKKLSSQTADIDFAKAKRIALRFLKVRDRSEHEIREKLINDQVMSEVIQKTIDYLKTVKLIDDLSFARDWLENRQKKSYGLPRVIEELKNKGISDEIINAVIGDLNKPENERKTIIDLIEKQKLKHQDLQPEIVKQRLFEYCVRRGFTPELVEDILTTYENRLDS